MKRTIKVKYLCTQGAEDLFYDITSKRKVYIRQPSYDKEYVLWLTSSKWSGGYEADCPVSSRITFEVLDEKDNCIFSEHNLMEENFTVHGKKKYPFFEEQIKMISERCRSYLEALDYESWKKVMSSDKEYHNYTGYSDTWLFCSSIKLSSKVSYLTHIYGMKIYLKRSIEQHKVSKKKWAEFTLVSNDDSVVYEIVGYIFITSTDRGILGRFYYAKIFLKNLELQEQTEGNK